MDKREVIEIVKKYKLLISGYFDCDKVYLFGSYAKGTNQKDSDIDVAVIVNQIKGDYFSNTPLLWKLRRQIDDRIEPILINKNDDRSGFLSEIQKSGIEID
jgi:predicted nucleotidyltransferase